MYDEAKAKRAVSFFNSLKHTKGKWKNVISTDNGVFVTVKVINISNRIQKATTKINSSLGKSAITDLWLAPTESRSVSFSFNGEMGQLSASVGDGTNFERIIYNPGE